MDKDTLKAISDVWDYLSVRSPSAQFDAIFLLGRDDNSIPEKGFELFKENPNALLLPLGKRGRLTGKIIGTESEAFRDYLVSKGVPSENIIIENNSTNTGENFTEGLKIIRSLGRAISRIAVVTHPPHMRRAIAIASFQDKDIEWHPIPDDCGIPSTKDGLLATAREIVGEIERLRKYPKLGYFSEQKIPSRVIQATDEIQRCLSGADL